MKVFDDKTKGVFQNNKYFVVSDVYEAADVTFKASYIVISNLVAKEKVTAFFDLIVLGDIEAPEIDVKGRLVCLGTCEVEGAIVVQNDIWANEIIAESVVSNGQIVAQNIEVSDVAVDGSLVVGKTLSIEDIAEIGNSLLCGETAFGAGRIVAESVLTVEPLDLDEGVDAIEDPNEYHAEKKKKDGTESYIKEGTDKFKANNDYESYVAYLMQYMTSSEEKTQLNDWLGDMYYAEDLADDEFANCTNGTLLVKLLAIQGSRYFAEWDIVKTWINSLKNHFEAMLQGTEKKYKTVPCNSMKKGDVVLHTKFGKGKVIDIQIDAKSKYTVVEFWGNDGYYGKKFIIPECFKFFEKIEEIDGDNASKIEQIDCKIDGYAEWLQALSVIEKNRKIIGDTVHAALFDRLMAYVGLKAKYMNDRFKEKGWK